MTNEAATPPPSSPPPRDTTDHLHDRMEAFGREAQAAGERLGRQAQVAGERFGKEAQATGERLARDPGVVSAGVWMARLWGLVLIAIGLWFFAQVTLGMDLPTFDWDLVWPLVLIVVGGSILVSGLARRR
jgi:hypothetical protein